MLGDHPLHRTPEDEDTRAALEAPKFAAGYLYGKPGAVEPLELTH